MITDIVWVEACLRNPKGIERNSSIETAARFIQEWVLEAILPSRMFAQKWQFDPTPLEDSVLLKVLQWQLMATAGIRLLEQLHLLVPNFDDMPSIDLMTCLTSFTDTRDPWTTYLAYEAASRLLAELAGNIVTFKKGSFHGLITQLLHDRVKPLFAKSRSAAVTTSGRKALGLQQRFTEPGDLEPELRPWKFKDAYIVTVLRWVLRQTVTGTEENWPLVIPPVLTLIDDDTIRNKIRGCELLIIVLQTTSSSILKQTGLGEVFHDALIPCLSYLPSLTQEEESLELLAAVYPTLICLMRTRFPREIPDPERSRSLDKILRVAVSQGYTHAGEHVKIAELLIGKIADLVNEMGTHSIKHLRNLIPFLVETLTAPFATTYLPLLLASATTMQAIILNCWPRLQNYYGKALKGVTICWIRIQEDSPSNPELAKVKQALQECTKLIIFALWNSNEFSLTANRIEPVLHGNPTVRELLQGQHSCL